MNERRIIAFLSEPRSYPHHPKRVRMLQTHASLAFIAPPFVYKVKKPVNLGFLDFSTLAKRLKFCRREVLLNRRLCSDVYLGVVPLFSKHGRLSFEEGGEVVEYAVKMRHLPERYFIERLLARGEVGPREIGRIVGVLKGFYQGHRTTPEISRWGAIGKLRISTDENFRQTSDFVGETLSRAARDAVRAYTNAFLEQHADLFQARVREGRIRDCHGDLHAEHIHITPDALSIYDCIEFNDRFRYVDVASDVAFLAMDFDFRGHPELARMLVSEMAGQVGDPGMLRLIDFYKCYRAYVRGKVESFHSRAPEAPEIERRESGRRARRYFRLALQYAVAGSHPMALAIMGRVGSGKSTLAAGLAQELGWQVFSSDRVRKELAGVPLRRRGDAAQRAKLYSKAMTRRTYAALIRHAVTSIGDTHGVVLDATFSRGELRDRLRQRLERMRVDYCFIEARVADDIARQRLAGRDGNRREVSDARIEDFAKLDGSYSQPSEIPARHVLRTETYQTPDEVLRQTLIALVERRARVN